MEEACFGAGCFWGVQAAFDKINGIIKTRVGYMGGHVKNPSYEQVCTNTTGHAEVVYVQFDPSIVSYERLLHLFFSIHDPTQKNRQGVDVGSQYRSIIFYYNDQQEKMAKDIVEKKINLKEYKKSIVTEIVPASVFYEAEEYHQDYFKKNRLSGCRF